MIKWISAWAAEKIDWYTLRAFLVLLFLLNRMTIGLAGVIRQIEPGLLWPISVLGLFFGWWLAGVGIAKWGRMLLILFTGLVAVSMEVGGLWHQVWLLLNELIGLVWEAVRNWTMLDMTPLLEGIVYLFDQILLLVKGLLSWPKSLSDPLPVYDPIARGMVWGMVVWGVTIWASWFMQGRKQPIIGVAPAIVLVAMNVSYLDSQPGILVPMLGAMLMLIVLVFQGVRELDWDKNDVGFSGLIRRNSMWVAVSLAVLLMFAAAITPSVSLKEIVDRFRDPDKEFDDGGELARSLGIEPAPKIVPQDVLIRKTRGMLPTDHLIGSGPELSDQLVMIVRVEELELNRAQEDSEKTAPLVYYWRSLTYNEYSIDGWFSESESTIVYKGGELAVQAYTSKQQLIRQEVHIVDDVGGLMFVAGELVVADSDYEVAWRRQSKEGDYFDMFGGMINDQIYRADSIIPVIDEDGLRKAGEMYPDWVTDNYLQIHDQVPARVLSLAHELTVDKSTPYERAKAIETYLRTFPYTLDLPERPIGQDIADYFLFDLKKGYCDYYATTMVVLARAVGLPARVAVGYLGSTYDEKNDYYRVTADLAHSWVEIYFPNYGWVTFEPTPGRSELTQITPPEKDEVERITNIPVEPFIDTNLAVDYGPLNNKAVGILVFSILAGLGFWLFVDRWILFTQSPEIVITKIYRRLNRLGRWVGVPLNPADTPYEFSACLEISLQELADTKSLGEIFEFVPDEIAWLTERCIQALYSLEPIEEDEKSRVINTWMRLRWQLILAGVIMQKRSWHRAGRPQKSLNGHLDTT